MSDEWEQIKEIFDAALGQKADERKAFLDRVCAGNEAVRREVESLLSSFDRAESFMVKPIVGEMAEAVTVKKKFFAKGHLLGHYEIVEPIGAGGMSEVYLAEDTLLKRRVAVKLLNQVSDKNQDHLRRFFQEARSASALNHPNILTIHEIGQTDGTHFIATEYITGETLRQRLKRESFTLSETLEIAVQIVAFQPRTKRELCIGTSNRKM